MLDNFFKFIFTRTIVLVILLAGIINLRLDHPRIHQERSDFLRNICYNSGFNPKLKVIFLDYLTLINPYNKKTYDKLIECYKELGQKEQADRVLQRSNRLALKEIRRNE